MVHSALVDGSSPSCPLLLNIRDYVNSMLQGVLGLLNLETGTETLTEIEFAVVFLVLLLVTNWKSPPSNKSL